MMTGAYTICKAQESDMTEILRLQHIAYQRIPLIGQNGIPLRHEIDFVMQL